VGIPSLVIVSFEATNPQAQFYVESGIIFVTSQAVASLVFIPKMLALRVQLRATYPKTPFDDGSPRRPQRPAKTESTLTVGGKPSPSDENCDRESSSNGSVTGPQVTAPDNDGNDVSKIEPYDNDSHVEAATPDASSPPSNIFEEFRPANRSQMLPSRAKPRFALEKGKSFFGFRAERRLSLLGGAINSKELVRRKKSGGIRVTHNPRVSIPSAVYSTEDLA
jgi:hypothetical protein